VHARATSPGGRGASTRYGVRLEQPHRSHRGWVERRGVSCTSRRGRASGTYDPACQATAHTGSARVALFVPLPAAADAGETDTEDSTSSIHATACHAAGLRAPHPHPRRVSAELTRVAHAARHHCQRACSAPPWRTPSFSRWRVEGGRPLHTVPSSRCRSLPRRSSHAVPRRDEERGASSRAAGVGRS
jgi:hypothetical protein